MYDVFRWDALEDFVIYGLIMLGLIVRYVIFKIHFMIIKFFSSKSTFKNIFLILMVHIFLISLVSL